MKRTSCNFYINWKKTMNSIPITLGNLVQFRHFRHSGSRILLYTTLILYCLYATNAFCANWTFIPRASVQGEYTDNLFLSTVNEEDDYLTTLSAGLTAGVAGRTGNLSLSFTPGYVFYDENDTYNGWRLPASLIGWWDMTKHTLLEFTDNFLYTEDPNPNRQADPQQGAQPPSEIDTTERTGREPYLTNFARLRLSHQFGQRDQVYIEYINRLRRNDDKDLQATDREDSSGHIPSAGLTVWMTPQWGLDFVGRYTKGFFEQPVNFVGIPSSDFKEWYGSGRLNHGFSRSLTGYFQYAHTYMDFEENYEFDYNTYHPSIGIDYLIDQDIEFLASIGYFVRKYKDAVVQGVQEELDRGSGFTFNADFIKTLKRGSYRLNASAGYDLSYFGNQNRGFTRYYLAGYGVDYFLIKQLRVDSYALYRRNEYEDEIPQRNDNVYRFTAGLSYIPLDWLSIRLAYTYNRIDSNFPVNDYTENRGMLTFSFSPERPYLVFQ